MEVGDSGADADDGHSLEDGSGEMSQGSGPAKNQQPYHVRCLDTAKGAYA